MIVLNVKLARAIWLVDARDLNPRGIDILPIISAVRDRYEFQIYPTSITEVQNTGKGIVFESGSFTSENQRYAIGRATIYDDGVVVDCSLSTDLSEAFLNDLLSFLRTDFGLTYRPDMIHRKIYTSELIVQTNKDLDRLFGPLALIKERLMSLTGREFEPSGVSLAIDPAMSASQSAPFRFEREVNKAFNLRRYYSSAPLRTGEHEDLLTRMEEIL